MRCARSGCRKRRRGPDRKLGNHRRFASGAATHPRFRRQCHHRRIAALSRQPRRLCAADRALVGANSERDQHAIAVIGSRRTTIRMESARNFYQLAYAASLYSGRHAASATPRPQGALAAKEDDSGDRLGIIEIVSAGKTRHSPKKFGAVTARSPPSSPWRSNRPPAFRCGNRIISGWSHGLLVVEAALNSGAYHRGASARAGPLGVAVPGTSMRTSAQGSNRLISKEPSSSWTASD